MAKKEVKEIKEIEEGNCPHCGHDCQDEYIGISARLINEKYYDTMKCSKCHRKFDRVYSMVLLKSQPTLTTQEILKGEK